MFWEWMYFIHHHGHHPLSISPSRKLPYFINIDWVSLFNPGIHSVHGRVQRLRPRYHVLQYECWYPLAQISFPTSMIPIFYTSDESITSLNHEVSDFKFLFSTLTHRYTKKLIPSQHYTKYCIWCHPFYLLCSMLIVNCPCNVINTKCNPKVTWAL